MLAKSIPVPVRPGGGGVSYVKMVLHPTSSFALLKQYSTVKSLKYIKKDYEMSCALCEYSKPAIGVYSEVHRK